MSGLQCIMLADVIWSLHGGLQQSTALRGASECLLRIHPRISKLFINMNENPPESSAELPFLQIRWWRIHLLQALKPVNLWHCPALKPAGLTSQPAPSSQDHHDFTVL